MTMAFSTLSMASRVSSMVASISDSAVMCRSFPSWLSIPLKETGRAMGAYSSKELAQLTAVYL